MVLEKGNERKEAVFIRSIFWNRGGLRPLGDPGLQHSSLGPGKPWERGGRGGGREQAGTKDRGAGVESDSRVGRTERRRGLWSLGYLDKPGLDRPQWGACQSGFRGQNHTKGAWSLPVVAADPAGL